MIMRSQIFEGFGIFLKSIRFDDVYISIENYYQTGTNGAAQMVVGSDANILSTSLGDELSMVALEMTGFMVMKAMIS